MLALNPETTSATSSLSITGIFFFKMRNSEDALQTIEPLLIRSLAGLVFDKPLSVSVLHTIW